MEFLNCLKSQIDSRKVLQQKTSKEYFFFFAFHLKHVLLFKTHIHLIGNQVVKYISLIAFFFPHSGLYCIPYTLPLSISNTSSSFWPTLNFGLKWLTIKLLLTFRSLGNSIIYPNSPCCIFFIRNMNSVQIISKKLFTSVFM